MNIEQFLNGYEVENMWVEKGVEKNYKKFFERIEKKRIYHFFIKQKGRERGISPGRIFFRCHKRARERLKFRKS